MPVEQFRLGRIDGFFVLLDSAQFERACDARRGGLLAQSTGSSSGRLGIEQIGGRTIRSR
ncbi:hypothetical protein [Rhodococcus sp. UNC363MFTsu5.1]|uniref:hypothetical protein n=1 Tax=Rhodococcus sp. UNC363MFTsu5.1 TaxID=1449069 RepID=UPI000A4F036F|nr:hypothetical protein [Rhodococcus sp. UNC363MFTsu5.1]